MQGPLKIKKTLQCIGLTLITCFFSQTEVSAKCTKVIVDYCDGGYYQAYDWTASAEFTPCNSPPSTRSKTWLHAYKNNVISIESGTPFSIGAQGTDRDIYDLFQTGRHACPTGDEFHVYCGGNGLYISGLPRWCSTDSKCVCRNPRLNTCAPVPESNICSSTLESKKPAPTKKPVEVKKSSAVKKH